MSDLTIKTNRHWRNLAYRSDVPAAVLADQFDWLDEDDGSDGFFQYRKRWYHLSEFMHANHGAFGDWEGYTSDSYFSGVLIRLSRDGEQVMCGTYFS